MNKIIISLVILFIVLVFLLFYFTLSTKSFEGSVSEVNENGYLLIDCPVPDFGSRDDVAYMCEVQITDNSVITKSNGELVSLKNIEIGDSLLVTLSKRHFLGKDFKSREVKAKEIVLLP